MVGLLAGAGAGAAAMSEGVGTGAVVVVAEGALWKSSKSSTVNMVNRGIDWKVQCKTHNRSKSQAWVLRR